MTYCVPELSVATEIEDEPSIVRIILAEILTIDGYIEAKFHILIPRWLLTAVPNNFEREHGHPTSPIFRKWLSGCATRLRGTPLGQGFLVVSVRY